jgi:hypothetical protein
MRKVKIVAGLVVFGIGAALYFDMKEPNTNYGPH